MERTAIEYFRECIGGGRAAHMTSLDQVERAFVAHQYLLFAIKYRQNTRVRAKARQA
jgi:hypothetical protein